MCSRSYCFRWSRITRFLLLLYMMDEQILLKRRRGLYIVVEIILFSSQITYAFISNTDDSTITIMLILSGLIGIIPFLCTLFLSRHVIIHIYTLDVIMSLTTMFCGVIDVNVTLTYITDIPYQVFLSIGITFIMGSVLVFHFLWSSEHCNTCNQCPHRKAGYIQQRVDI